MDHSGAGILIIESYKGRKVITLFGMKNGEFSDPGGKKDPGESIEHTAYRETREETLNLITLKPEELEKIGRPITLKEYLCFVIYVEGINHQDYNHNKQLVNRCRPSSWKETNTIARFDVKEMMNTIYGKRLTAKDINGGIRKIRKRTLELIEKSESIIKGFTQPYKLEKYHVNNSRLGCLIGTNTYRLKVTSFMIGPSELSMHKYGLYIAPDSNFDKDFNRCSKKDEGLHVVLVGFSNKQPDLKQLMFFISKSGKKRWKLNPKKTKLKENKITFNSRTLDKIGDFLAQNSAIKTKGPKHDKTPWHIVCDGQISQSLYKKILGSKWSLILVRMEKGGIKWLDKMPLNTN